MDISESHRLTFRKTFFWTPHEYGCFDRILFQVWWNKSIYSLLLRVSGYCSENIVS